MTGIKSVSEELLLENWKIALEKFITHYVWHQQDRRTNPTEAIQPTPPYWFRLEGRLTEM